VHITYRCDICYKISWLPKMVFVLIKSQHWIALLRKQFFLCNSVIYKHFNICMYKRGNGIIKMYSLCNILLPLLSSVIFLAGTPLNRITVYKQVMLQEYLSCTVCLNICYFNKRKEIKISQLNLNLVFDNYHILLFMHLI
jgi:hypothetical protein